MSEFYGNDKSFCENVYLNVEECRFVHWISKLEPCQGVSAVASDIIEKWSAINIETIKIINTNEYTGIIGISLNKIYTTMIDYVKKYKTTPETLILINNSNPESPANIINAVFDKPLDKYNVPCSFPINWNPDKTPDSIVISSISENNIYRCYKLNPPIIFTEGGALIRTGEEFEQSFN